MLSLAVLGWTRDEIVHNSTSTVGNPVAERVNFTNSFLDQYNGYPF